MNKNISIALVALFALGAISVSAETDSTTTGTATTSVRPALRETSDQMEARVKALRASTTLLKQTQGATFGEKARLASTTAAIKGQREEIEKRAKEVRAEVEKKHTEIKDEQQKKRFELARKSTELVTKRLDAAIDRVQKLSDRVSAALDKFAAQGVNVTVSRGHLVEANTFLTKARLESATVKLEIETAFASSTPSTASSTTPKDMFKKVQGLVKDTTKTIQEAHSHVALAISTIKPGLNKPRPATTTATTTQ